jgi:hypothetical protein
MIEMDKKADKDKSKLNLRTKGKGVWVDQIADTNSIMER